MEYYRLMILYKNVVSICLLSIFIIYFFLILFWMNKKFSLLAIVNMINNVCLVRLRENR